MKLANIKLKDEEVVVVDNRIIISKEGLEGLKQSAKVSIEFTKNLMFVKKDK